MSQGPYPPGYEPADGAPPARPAQEGYPDAPPSRATARVPQPPPWAPPQSAQPPGPPSPYGSDTPYGAQQPPPPPPAPGHPQYPPSGFGTPPPPTPQSGPPAPPAPPATGRVSVPGAIPASAGGPPPQTYTPPPGTYGAPAAPATYGTPASSPPYSPPNSGSTYGSPAPGPTYGAPPGPDPSRPPHGGPELSRFASLRYDDPPIDEPRTGSKRGLIIGIVIAAVVVLALAGGGVTWALSQKSSGSSFAVNSCVKKSDDKAVAVDCSSSGAYQIVSTVDGVDKCPDKGQPYVVLQESGKPDQVLCLKPAH
jgi:hypothetical protein